MTIETKGDFSNEDLMKKLNARLLSEQSGNIERENTRVRARLFGIFLEIAATGYAWYHFGWQAVIVIVLLFWAINIKVGLGE